VRDRTAGGARGNQARYQLTPELLTTLDQTDCSQAELATDLDRKKGQQLPHYCQEGIAYVCKAY